jgi:hypothetical protein
VKAMDDLQERDDLIEQLFVYADGLQPYERSHFIDDIQGLLAFIEGEEHHGKPMDNSQLRLMLKGTRT